MPSKSLDPGDWIVAVRPAPMTIGRGKDVFRPDMSFVIHAPSGVILDSVVMEAGSSPARVADKVKTVLRDGPTLKIPAPVPPPTRLCTDDRVLARFLEKVAGPSVPVVVRAIPEIEEVLDSLDAFMERHPAEDAKRATAGDVDRDALAAFFAAADRVHALAPWERASDTQVIGVDASAYGWGKAACLSIIGALGESHGLLLFKSFEDYESFPEQMEPAQASGRPAVVDAPMFVVNFDHKRDAPKDHFRQAKALGVAPRHARGFPWIQNLGPRSTPLDLDASDYAFATALLDAVAVLLENHPDVFESDVERPVRTGGPRGSRGVIKLVVPHPEMPWRWGEDPSRYYRREDGADLIDDYVAATPIPAAQRKSHLEAIARLLAYKIDALDEGLFDWTPEQVRHYLLEHFPARERPADKEIPNIPDWLWSFFNYLGGSGHADPEAMRLAANEVTRCRDEFVRRANDRTLFSPAKTIALEMERAGVDPRDPAAMTRFMDDFNARVAKDPDLLPLPPGMAVRQRWSPKAGDPLPDPVGPCPCGSGRRYKRCCQPR